MFSLKSASGFLIGGLEKIFYRWGLFASQHPYPVILVSLILTGLTGIGFLNFRQEHQADKLWIPPTSEYLVNKEWLAGNFQGKYRHEGLIFKKDNVLTPEAIKQMWEIHRKIEDITIHGFTYRDICTHIPVGDIFHSDNPTTTYICDEEEPADASGAAEKVEREKDDLWTDYYDYGAPKPNEEVESENFWTDYEEYPEDYDYDGQSSTSRSARYI